VRSGVALASSFEQWVRDESGWELCAPRNFSVVCFRLTGDDTDARNRALMEAVNATGEIFISHCVLNGVFVLRLAVGQLSTTESDVRRAWDVLRAAADRG
jgi:glutamate/tyrosine decarboxylase-like PLP-dependent enzyme